VARPARKFKVSRHDDWTSLEPGRFGLVRFQLVRVPEEYCYFGSVVLTFPCGSVTGSLLLLELHIWPILRRSQFYSRRPADRPSQIVSEPPGEFQLISRLCRGLRNSPRTLLGPGDDCAVLAVGGIKQLITIDSLVEGVHFKLEWFAPQQLGARALGVNLSDIAAMGGRPAACVIDLALRDNLPKNFAERLYAGLKRAARAAGIDIAGGNVTRAAQVIITVALLGRAGRAVLRRDGARAADDIFVTGTLGDAALGWRILDGRLSAPPHAREFLVGRYISPIARLNAGVALARLRPVPAAIDLSDGLAGDLRHILKASGVGAELDARLIPVSAAYRAVAGEDLTLALSGGDDYELLFCMAARYSERELTRRLGVRVTRIGRIVRRSRGFRIKNLPAKADSRALRGWDHLRRGA
jgi:thiamine-monophosphate kinase